ncbi:SAF domain-containing protein [Phycicoccus avicenniae]|uniref:SAF domain-containing protein n=1 Tax=Phycicoccus avicenniae TaxID=2828860 RepID=UPI003D2DAF53
MTERTPPFPGVTGRGRRARWRRSVLRRVVAALCLAGAAVAGLQVVRPPPPPTAEVLVASGPVPAGAVLTAADVEVVRVPVVARQPGALDAVGSAVGRRSASSLAAGEAVTRTRLVPRTAAEGLAAGSVALHVGLADPAAADVLAPGQQVAVFPAPGGPVLARDATVLAVDPPGGASVVDIGGGPPRGVLLALPSGSAERVLAGHGGTDGGVSVTVVARGG